jgi:hypothetical protein
MRSHLQEEEESIPALIRSNFTEEEESNTVDKILKAGGLALTKTFFPAILLSMQLWMTPESYDEFCKSLPMPIKHLTFKVRLQVLCDRLLYSPDLTLCLCCFIKHLSTICPTSRMW